MQKSKKNISFYLGEEKEDKFEMFNRWCFSEGVLMPKIEFPAVFEHGLIGMKCTADI